MINKAIEKMTMECEQNKDKAYYNALVYIEEHYTRAMNERIAEKLLAEDKDLTGAYRKLEGFAKAGHLTCITDEEGFGICDEYYGITQEDYSFKSRASAPAEDMDDILDLI